MNRISNIFRMLKTARFMLVGLLVLCVTEYMAYALNSILMNNEVKYLPGSGASKPSGGSSSSSSSSRGVVVNVPAAEEVNICEDSNAQKEFYAVDTDRGVVVKKECSTGTEVITNVSHCGDLPDNEDLCDTASRSFYNVDPCREKVYGDYVAGATVLARDGRGGTTIIGFDKKEMDSFIGGSDDAKVCYVWRFKSNYEPGMAAPAASGSGGVAGAGSGAGNSAGADNGDDSGTTPETAEEQSDNDEPDNVDDGADDADLSTGAGGTNTSTTNCNTQQEKDDRGASEIKMSGNLCIAKMCKQNYYRVKNNNVYQGWCNYISCPADQEPNIDAQDMWDQKTAKCRAKSTTTDVTDEPEPQAEAESAEVSTAVVTEQTPEPCEDTNQGIQSGHIVNGICVPDICITPDWTLINGKCVHADGTDCKDIMYMADTATYQNGVCTVHECYARFEVKENQCVEISGPCKSLPDNATRGHREYNEETESEKCIVDDCVDGYVVADDKLSCHEDYDALAKQAREREQSTGNKLLGAVGMGATGIGGAMLMSGLAESASDDEAERVMKAYLSTFTCKYGNASVPGGTMNVEIPGGNELIQMYAEYVALANDLKVRKEALGMKPGIESEAILDSATSGLYDDVSTGKTQGAYASLARALSDPNSEDAKIWAAQREESDEKKKTGAITAGTGAGASLVGNIISEGVDKNKKK